MNIEAIKEEVKCLSVMIDKEKERHECLVNPLYDRQIALMNKVNLFDELKKCHDYFNDRG